MSKTATHLTTGWEPDLDPADTLTRRYLFPLGGNDRGVRQRGRGPGAADPRAGRDRPGPSERLLQLDRSCSNRRANTSTGCSGSSTTSSGRRRSGSTCGACGRPPTCQIVGGSWSGTRPLLLRPPARSMPVEPHEGPAPDIRPVDSPRRLREWEKVAIEGYPLPEVDRDRPGAVANPAILDDPRVRLWVGYQDGAPVSIGTLFAEPGPRQPRARRHAARGPRSRALGGPRPRPSRHGGRPLGPPACSATCLGRWPNASASSRSTASPCGAWPAPEGCGARRGARRGLSTDYRKAMP